MRLGKRLSMKKYSAPVCVQYGTVESITRAAGCSNQSDFMIFTGNQMEDTEGSSDVHHDVSIQEYGLR